MKHAMFPVNRLSPLIQARRKRSPQSRAALLKSIKQHGILQPLLVVPHPEKQGYFGIISGNTRWELAPEAGLEQVPGYLLPEGKTQAEHLQIALTMDTIRTNLGFDDRADGIADFAAAAGITQAEAAASLGVSASTASKINTCSTCLAPEVKHFITEKKIGLSIAHILATRVQSAAEQLGVLERYVSEKWNREDLLKALKPSREPKKIAFTTTVNGVEVRMSFKAEASHSELVEALKSLAATISTHEKNRIPVRLLPELTEESRKSA